MVIAVAAITADNTRPSLNIHVLSEYNTVVRGRLLRPVILTPLGHPAAVGAVNIVGIKDVHPVLVNIIWHRAYDVGSVGGASLETVKRYVEAQGTQEKPRKAARRPLPA